MSAFFTVRHAAQNGRERTGSLRLPHGEARTPVFMPVGTNGTVKAVTNESLKEIGYNLILGNTYHLYLRPGTDVIQRAGGLRGFTQWDGNILTDSGGFQVFSLSALRDIREEGALFRSHIDGSQHLLTPEKAADIQCILKSDIQMQLDVCLPADAEEAAVKAALERTGRWLARSRASWLRAKDSGYEGSLFCIAQGGFFRHLRKQSVELCVEADVPGIAIGGLSVGEERERFLEYLAFTAALLPPDKPRYVMGIGTPDYILDAVENGIDMFDCVYPTRIARNGLALTRRGPLSIKKEIYKNDDTVLDPECSCPVCARYSKAYLRHLFKCKEILVSMLLSYHNLHFLHTLVKNAGEAIERDEFAAFKRAFLAAYAEGGSRQGGSL